MIRAFELLYIGFFFFYYVFSVSFEESCAKKARAICFQRVCIYIFVAILKKEILYTDFVYDLHNIEMIICTLPYIYYVEERTVYAAD